MSPTDIHPQSELSSQAASTLKVRESAWRLFLRRLALFLLPLLLLAAAAELYVRSLPNSYRMKAEMMQRMEDRVKVMILGNSHAYSGIRPELIPGCAVNLANVSQTLDLDLLLLEHYAPRCPRLREVVLPLDNSNLFDQPMQQTDEWFRCAYYRRYMHLGAYYRPRYWLELFHFQSLRGKIRKWRQQRQPDCTALGWDTDNSLRHRAADWNTGQVDRVLQRHICHDWEQASANQAMLLHIARYCREHHLRLLLVATPVYPAYAAGIPASQRRFLAATRLAARQEGATVLDFSADTTFCDPDFFDPDHLSHEGAAKFTRLLPIK